METKRSEHICTKLGAIIAEVKAIGKDSRNQTQGFNFRGIDAIMNHLHPIFAKHGVIILPEVLDDKTEERKTKSGGNLIYRILKIQFHFVAGDGSELCSTVIGEGMDSGDKAANKAMAVGLKYALTQMLLLPYDETDPDAESHPPSAKVQKQNKVASAKLQKTWSEVATEMKTKLGKDEYNIIIGDYGFALAEEIKDKEIQIAVYKTMQAKLAEIKKGKDNAESK